MSKDPAMRKAVKKLFRDDVAEAIDSYARQSHK